MLVPVLRDISTPRIHAPTEHLYRLHLLPFHFLPRSFYIWPLNRTGCLNKRNTNRTTFQTRRRILNQPGYPDTSQQEYKLFLQSHPRVQPSRKKRNSRRYRLGAADAWHICNRRSLWFKSVSAAWKEWITRISCAGMIVWSCSVALAVDASPLNG